MQGEVGKERSFKDSFTDAITTDTPPKEFFDIRRTSIPASYEVAKKRVEYNFVRFKTYYLGIFLLFTVVFILFKPSFIILLGIAAGGVYLHKNQISIKGRQITPLIVNVGIAASIFIFSMFFGSVITSTLALLSFIGITVLTHAVTLDEKSDESENV